MSEGKKLDPMQFAKDDGPRIPLHVVTSDGFETWANAQSDKLRNWLSAVGFQARSGEVAVLSDANGSLECAVAGLGSMADRQRSRFCMGGIRSKLPVATYFLEHDLDADSLAEEALGWLLAGYSYRRFRSGGESTLAALIAPDGVDANQLHSIADGERLTRDLINTPASHLGPQELEDAFADLATRFGASFAAIRGDALLGKNLPLVHAVGRASDREPRLLDMRWGKSGPRLTLVGKGVCFDTGGLNLKPGSSMGLMKKDMGGAATILGLAQMIMTQGWPVQLRVIVPAVENAVAGNAMRPGDILMSRKGLSIEVNNTDAEGRLVLADALCLADEETPDLVVCMATLTGAARVALGPDVAPFFTRDREFSGLLQDAGEKLRDPVWPLPLHPGYERLIEPGIADLDNAPSGGMAGAITAALFLQRFVSDTTRFVHFDIYGYQPQPAPGCPKGGIGQAARALLGALPKALQF